MRCGSVSGVKTSVWNREPLTQITFSQYLEKEAFSQVRCECSDNKYIAVGSIEPQFYFELLEKLEINDEQFKDQHNKDLWPRLKEKMAAKIKLKSRSEWVEIFSGTDACVSPVLSMEEAQEHPHNIAREAFTNIDGFNQPNASPRYSKTKPEIKHNAKDIGADLNDVCIEFNLTKEFF